MRFGIIGAVVIGVLASSNGLRAQAPVDLSGRWTVVPGKSAPGSGVFRDGFTLSQNRSEIMIDLNPAAVRDPALIQIYPLNGAELRLVGPPPQARAAGIPDSVMTLQIGGRTTRGESSSDGLRLTVQTLFRIVAPLRSPPVEEKTQVTVITLRLDEAGDLIATSQAQPDVPGATASAGMRSVYRKN